jgi:hypothetical protein
MKQIKEKRRIIINDRILLITMALVLALSVAIVIALETLPYEHIQVDDGTLYGKLEPVSETLIILVAGSGPTDMDGNSSILKGQNNSLLQLSRALNQEGYATFRYDKRTAGKSRNSFKGQSISFVDFADDLEAVTESMYQKGYRHIYLAGHSQGSLLVMMVANRIPVDGVISLAGPGETIDQTLLRQFSDAYGMDSEQAMTIKELQAGKQISLEGDLTLSDKNLTFITNWMKYDPAVEAARLTVPLLIIQGADDSQVRVEDAKSLKEAQPEATLLLVKDMNHLLKQVASPKENIASYTDPSFQLHLEIIDTINEFVDYHQ